MENQYRARVQVIAQELREADIDAALISSEINRLYASGFMTSRGMVFITNAADAYFLTDSRYREMGEKALRGTGYTLCDNTLDPLGKVNELIDRHRVQRLGVENHVLTLREYDDFDRKLRAELAYLDDRIDKHRAFLSEEDRDRLEYAQSLAERALTETLEVVRVGMTEKELEAELIYRMYLYGADDLAFKPEILSGANTSMPHGNPSDKVIREGDVLLMDFGLVKDGYWSDMSRTFCVKKIPEGFQEIYDTVLAAQELAIEAYRVGMGGKALDAVARDYIESKGMAGCYEHALGHGIGQLGAAPLALANRVSDTVFRPGNTITVEPGIYQPGRFGCRIEDIVWLGVDGEKCNLTHFPKAELMLVG